MLAKYKVKTTKHTSIVNITSQVRQAVISSGIKDGLCVIYTPHTTAGIFINEGADPDVLKDIVYVLEKLVPWEDRNYSHSEGNSAAHIKSSIIGNSRIVIVENSELLLGTWESIYLADFDGPRERTVFIYIINSI